jgi:hypothetical protein
VVQEILTPVTDLLDLILVIQGVLAGDVVTGVDRPSTGRATPARIVATGTMCWRGWNDVPPAST